MHAAPQNSPVSIRIIYRGNVQGVGFRYTTNHIARRHAVSGYVKNLPDGTVELVALGLKNAVDRFLDEVDGTFIDHISDKETTSLNESLPLEGFAIRR